MRARRQASKFHQSCHPFPTKAKVIDYEVWPFDSNGHADKEIHGGTTSGRATNRESQQTEWCVPLGRVVESHTVNSASLPLSSTPVMGGADR